MAGYLTSGQSEVRKLSLKYAKVNKKRNKPVVALNSDENVEEEKMTSTSPDSYWQEIESRNLTLEELLDLETRKGVNHFKNSFIGSVKSFIFKFWDILNRNEEKDEEKSIRLYDINRKSRTEDYDTNLSKRLFTSLKKPNYYSSSIYTGNGQFYIILQVDLKEECFS